MKTLISLSMVMFVSLIVAVPLNAAEKAKPADFRSTDRDQGEPVMESLKRRITAKQDKTDTSRVRKAGKNGARVRYPTAKIEAKVPDKTDMTDVAKQVAQLEIDTDDLASRVQKAKQTIFEEANVSNFVEIEARLPSGKEAALKTLEVKLDGFEIYALDDASGLWLPTAKFPVYAGPMQPGNHRVDLEARLVLRQKGNVAVNNDSYRMISKSFDIGVPDGSAERRWVIDIAVPDTAEGKVEAALQSKTPPEQAEQPEQTVK